VALSAARVPERRVASVSEGNLRGGWRSEEARQERKGGRERGKNARNGRQERSKRGESREKRRFDGHCVKSFVSTVSWAERMKSTHPSTPNMPAILPFLVACFHSFAVLTSSKVSEYLSIRRRAVSICSIVSRTRKEGEVKLLSAAFSSGKPASSGQPTKTLQKLQRGRAISEWSEKVRETRQRTNRRRDPCEDEGCRLLHERLPCGGRSRDR
jgi:hypothetical protein